MCFGLLHSDDDDDDDDKNNGYNKLKTVARSDNCNTKDNNTRLRSESVKSSLKANRRTLQTQIRKSSVTTVSAAPVKAAPAVKEASLALVTARVLSSQWNVRPCYPSVWFPNSRFGSRFSLAGNRLFCALNFWKCLPARGQGKQLNN